MQFTHVLVLLLLFCCVLFSNWLAALFMGILRVPWLYLFIIYILPRTVVNKTITTATNRKKYRKCANFYGPAALSRACEYLFIYESSSIIPSLCMFVCVCRCVGVLMWFSKNTYFKVPSASQMIWVSLPEVHCFVAAVSFSASGFARLFNSIFILIISVVICFRPCPTSHLALVSSFVKFNEHSECRKWKAAFPQPAQSAMSLTNVWMNA